MSSCLMLGEGGGVVVCCYLVFDCFCSSSNRSSAQLLPSLSLSQWSSETSLSLSTPTECSFFSPLQGSPASFYYFIFSSMRQPIIQCAPHRLHAFSSCGSQCTSILLSLHHSLLPASAPPTHHTCPTCPPPACPAPLLHLPIRLPSPPPAP